MRVRSKEFSWDHAMEMAENMLHMARVLAPMEQEHQRLQRKLKEFPKGFHLEGKGYSCGICYGSCSQEETWYDQYGLKCMECQAAVDRGEIPASLVKDRESYYSSWEIERAFNVDRHAVRRWAKAGVIKARIVKHLHHQDTQLFLLEDNKDTLPPRKMVEHYSRSEHMPDGTTKLHTEYWYQHVDPYKYLKGYKIMDQLQVVNGQLQAKPKEK
ncbi:MAG: Uncharacterized protein G01um101425_385 [Candidatus Peregrinibacteria bacterium Gr01-1014_25]|nr:MAG: Uncharacterized protein G01um101425_385 [Candidatus Peregrinibacteria bacterium Gr01-1014_25]